MLIKINSHEVAAAGKWCHNTHKVIERIVLPMLNCIVLVTIEYRVDVWYVAEFRNNKELHMIWIELHC